MIPKSRPIDTIIVGAAIAVASILLLNDHWLIDRQISINELGNTEDGTPFIHKKPGHARKYAYFQICDVNGALQLHKGIQCQNPVATARWKNSINITGWGFLEMETFATHSPRVQAYAAGYLEGALTKKLIEHHIKNLADEYCKGHTEYCDRVKEFITENQQWTKQELEKQDVNKDRYWAAVDRTYHQLSGLIDAFEKRPFNVRATFEDHPIVFLNWIGETYDLQLKFNRTMDPSNTNDHCSALVKLAPNNADIYFSHVSFFGYNTMLRLVKLYKFGYDRKQFPGYAVSYSGYPGVLNSQDDFQMTSSKLAIMETTIGNYNKESTKDTKALGQLPTWINSIIASQLASSAKEWVDIFIKNHMGTYNNQWMVVDYKLFTPGQPLKEGLYYVLETLPGFEVHKDMTEHLTKGTYWPSYNLPHFMEIYNYSMNEQYCQEYAGDFYRPWKAPRGKIFERDHSKATDFESFMQLMRSNDYQNDPLSKCNCEPQPYSAELAISARGDLNPANGKYPISQIGHRNHGSTDFKAVDLSRVNSFTYRAWATPTFNKNIAPFQWSTFEANSPIRVSHEGHPDKFDFPYVEVAFETPIWN